MKQYIITYSMYESSHGFFRYAARPTKTSGIHYFNKSERESFIERAEYLIKNDMYFDDIKLYFINFEIPKIIDITDRLQELKESI